MNQSHSIAELTPVIYAVTDVLLANGLHDKCISGSAILLHTLHQSGYSDAYPMSVSVRITPISGGETGIHLGKGTDPQPGKWPGHLVVIIPSFFNADHLLIDLTIVQVNDKVPGIVLDPFVGLVDKEFVNGTQQPGIEANGCHVFYEAFPSDDSYITAPGWSGISSTDKIIQTALVRVAQRRK